MNLRRFAVFAFAALLLATGTASAQQPRPLPLSPENMRLAAQYPALRDERAAATGGFVISDVGTLSCNSNQLVVELALVIPDPSRHYVMRTIVVQNQSRYMNQRVERNFSSGIINWFISNSATGGSVGHAFPLTDNEPLLVQMLLSQPDGKPLWYSEMQINDCNAAAASIGFRHSSPTRIITANPTFKRDSSGHAAKWTGSGKVAYACAGGACSFKLTGKTGKTAKLKQTVKISPPLPDGAILGLTAIADTAGTTGLVRLFMNPTSEGNPLFGSAYYNLVDGNPLFTTSEAIHMPNPVFALSPAVDKMQVRFEFLDDDSLPATGKVKLRALYLYAVDY